MEIRRTTHATRQLRKLPASQREAVIEGMRALENWPQVENVKRLRGRNDYRLRIGRFRVIFEIAQGVVWITQVLLRDDNTYQ